MIKIWKYDLPVGTGTLRIPKGAIFLFVREQHGVPTMWYQVDSDADIELRTFVIIGTGHEVPDNIGYLGSFFLHEGRFVGHVYEVVT